MPYYYLIDRVGGSDDKIIGSRSQYYDREQRCTQVKTKSQIMMIRPELTNSTCNSCLTKSIRTLSYDQHYLSSLLFLCLLETALLPLKPTALLGFSFKKLLSNKSARGHVITLVFKYYWSLRSLNYCYIVNIKHGFTYISHHVSGSSSRGQQT